MLCRIAGLHFAKPIYPCAWLKIGTVARARAAAARATGLCWLTCSNQSLSRAPRCVSTWLGELAYQVSMHSPFLARAPKAKLPGTSRPIFTFSCARGKQGDHNIIIYDITWTQKSREGARGVQSTIERFTDIICQHRALVATNCQKNFGGPRRLATLPLGLVQKSTVSAT